MKTHLSNFIMNCFLYSMVIGTHIIMNKYYLTYKFSIHIITIIKITNNTHEMLRKI